MTSVGDRIKEVRKSLKLTQTQFAQELAISQTHISKIEKGTEHPSSTLVRLISVIYNIDESWLKTGAGSPTPGWSIDTIDGLWSKYNYIRAAFEKGLKQSSQEDLYSMVQAFSFLSEMLLSKKLSADNLTLYLNSVCSAMDMMEKLIAAVSADKILLPSATDVNGWLNFKSYCTESLMQINLSVKSAVNVYLEKYGEEMKLR